MEEKVFNVSQVNKYVKMLIDSDAFLNNINITGEITNYGKSIKNIKCIKSISPIILGTFILP